MTASSRLTKKGKIGRKKVGERYDWHWEWYLKHYKPEGYKKYLEDLKYKNAGDKNSKISKKRKV